MNGTSQNREASSWQWMPSFGQSGKEWKNIFIIYIPNIYKELKKLDIKKTNNPVKTQATDLNIDFSKEVSQIVEKQCWTVLVSREMQIKTSFRFHLTLSEWLKRASSRWLREGNTYPLLVGVQACMATMTSVWQFLGKVLIDLHHSWVTRGCFILPLILVQPCWTLFIAALFIIARDKK